MFSLIIATDIKNGIGRLNGKIPFRNSADLKNFKELTKNNIVIMGRKTWDSIGHPLPNRINIIISSKGYKCIQPHQGINRADFMEPLSLQDKLSYFKQKKSPVIVYDNMLNCLIDLSKSEYKDMKKFVIGGAEIYKYFLDQNLVQEIYYTTVNVNTYCDVTLDLNNYLYRFALRNRDLYKNVINSIQLQTSDDHSWDYKEYEYVNYEEEDFLFNLENIMSNNILRSDRTGVNTYSKFGLNFEFDLSNNTIPLCTTRRMPLRMIFEELMWFLRGQTNSKILEEKNIYIWKGNTTREFLDNRGLFHYAEGDIGPCFIKGTNVWTFNGIKNIEDVEITDKLYTHNGKWKNVLNIQNRFYTGDMYKIRPRFSCENIVCTPEHPFYVRQKIISGKNIKNNNIIEYSDPEWLEAKYLTKDYLLGFKINSNSIIPKFNLTKYISQENYKTYEKTLDDKDEWFMLGYYLGNGWIAENDRICFAINTKYHDYVYSRISTYLNIKIKKEKIILSEKCSIYECNNQEYAFILKQFGKHVRGKIIPEWVQDSPIELIKEFIEGYFTADGCYAKNNINKKRFTTVSYNIAKSLQRLYMKLGIFCSISKQKRNYTLNSIKDRKINLMDYYFLECSYISKRRYKGFSYIDTDNHYAWVSIKELEKIYNCKEEVFNFEVEEDNSYSVDNIAVHNCYGHNFRHYGAPYKGSDKNYDNQGCDQLYKLLKLIKEDPYSRRLIINLWDPSVLDQCALPSCLYCYQFYVEPNEKGNPTYLSCLMSQRSSDIYLAGFWNICTGTLLTHLIARMTGLIPKKIHWSIGDAHIYKNQIQAVKEQISRKAKCFPKLYFKNSAPSINNNKNITEFEYSDLLLVGYNPHSTIKSVMNV